MSSLGTLSAIWRYPVKSMGGESLDAGHFGTESIAGDRGYALRDESTGALSDGKKIPKLMLCRARYLEEPDAQSLALPSIEILFPEGRRVRGDDSEIHRIISDYAGRQLRLVQREPPENFFDVEGVHLITRASISLVQNEAPKSIISATRFRPNLVIDTGKGSGWVENEWIGHQLGIGDLQLAVESRTERCSMVMRAQEETPEDAAVLRTVVAMGNHVGVYARVANAGRVELGDALVLDPKSAP